MHSDASAGLLGGWLTHVSEYWGRLWPFIHTSWLRASTYENRARPAWCLFSYESSMVIKNNPHQFLIRKCKRKTLFPSPNPNKTESVQRPKKLFSCYFHFCWPPLSSNYYNKGTLAELPLNLILSVYPTHYTLKYFSAPTFVSS